MFEIFVQRGEEKKSTFDIFFTVNMPEPVGSK